MGTLEERFWEKVDVRGPDECWPWTRASLDGKGYGQFRLPKKLVRSHRFAYELIHGPIPGGLDLDHTCHNAAAHRGECAGGSSCEHRRCCNPAHLEPVTRGDNSRRSPLGGRGPQDACDKGHAFTPDNTYSYPNGRRKCRECRRAEKRGWAARRRARAA